MNEQAEYQKGYRAGKEAMKKWLRLVRGVSARPTPSPLPLITQTPYARGYNDALRENYK